MNTQKAFDVLGINPNTHTYKQGYNRYRYLARIHHPDKGGSKEAFQDLQNAWELAKSLLNRSGLPLVNFVTYDDGTYERRFIFKHACNDGSDYLIWLSYTISKTGVYVIAEDVIADDLFSNIPHHERIINPKEHTIIFLRVGSYDPDKVATVIVYPSNIQT